MGLYGLRNMSEIFGDHVPGLKKPEVEEGDTTERVVNKLLNNNSLKEKSLQMSDKLFGARKESDVLNKIIGNGPDTNLQSKLGFSGNLNLSQKIGLSTSPKVAFTGNLDLQNKLGLNRSLNLSQFGVGTNNFGNKLAQLGVKTGGNNFNNILNAMSVRQASGNSNFNNIIAGFNKPVSRLTALKPRQALNSRQSLPRVGVSRENQVWAVIKPNYGPSQDVMSRNLFGWGKKREVDIAEEEIFNEQLEKEAKKQKKEKIPKVEVYYDDAGGGKSSDTVRPYFEGAVVEEKPSPKDFYTPPQDENKFAEGLKSAGATVGGAFKKGAAYVGGAVKGAIKTGQEYSILPTKEEIKENLRQRKEMQQREKILKKSQEWAQKYPLSGVKVGERIITDKEGKTVKEAIYASGLTESQRAELVRADVEGKLKLKRDIRRKEAGLPPEGYTARSAREQVLVKNPKTGKFEPKFVPTGSSTAGAGYSYVTGTTSSGSQSFSQKLTDLTNVLTSRGVGTGMGIQQSVAGAIVLPGSPESMSRAIGSGGGSWSNIQAATMTSGGRGGWENIMAATATRPGMSASEKILWMTASPQQKAAMLKQGISPTPVPQPAPIEREPVSLAPQPRLQPQQRSRLQQQVTPSKQEAPLAEGDYYDENRQMWWSARSKKYVRYPRGQYRK